MSIDDQVKEHDMTEPEGTTILVCDNCGREVDEAEVYVDDEGQNLCPECYYERIDSDPANRPK